MGKKRREEQRGSDSEIRHKCMQSGSSSRMSLEEIPRGASLENILQEMAQILRQMQVKEEKFTNIEEKLEEIEQKYERKFKKMKEKVKKHKKECKVMREALEELKEKDSVHSSGYTSPAQRTQPDKCQKPKFKLKIVSSVREKLYKGKSIQTNTMDCVQVQLFDGGIPIAYDHPLSSAKVKLVILKEEFNKDDDQEYWSKEDFMKGLKGHGEGNATMRIENCTFNLISGVGIHPGAIILDNSNRKKVKLGVMIVGLQEERVLDGISNLFKVQEAKTERVDFGGGDDKPSCTPTRENSEGHILAANGQQSYLHVPMNNWSHRAIARSAEHEQGHIVSHGQLSSPPSTEINSVQPSSYQLIGNGQILSGNSRQNFQPNSMNIPSASSSHTAVTHSGNLRPPLSATGQVVAGSYQQSFQQNSMDSSHDTGITHSGRGESAKIPQDYGQPQNIYPPCNPSTMQGGNGIHILRGIQTRSTSTQTSLG